MQPSTWTSNGIIFVDHVMGDLDGGGNSNSMLCHVIKHTDALFSIRDRGRKGGFKEQCNNS